jgi:uncharacterized protein (DUF58 family)
MLRLIPFLLGLFLIAALLRVDFFFTLAYLFFAVYVLSRLWSGRALPQLTIKREFVRRAFHGDEVPVTVTLRNDGRLPVTWVQARESLPVELGVPARQNRVFSLNPREAHSLSYNLQCRKRGVYALGPLQVRSGDLFGLTPLAGAEAPPDRLIVYPRVVPLEKLNLPTRSPLAALSARTPLFEDPARVVGVRDYVPGDSQRRIHWTATASAGRLLVKNYQPAIARETVICLDLNAESYDIRGRYDAIELAITAAASVANHVIVRERQPAGLITEARDKLTDAAARFVLPAQAGRAHLMNVLEALARAQFTQGRSFAQFVRQESVHLGWGTTLVIITGHEAPLLDTLAQLRQAGFPVALILVQAARPSAATRQRAAVLRIPVYPLWRERDLESLM